MVGLNPNKPKITTKTCFGRSRSLRPNTCGSEKFHSLTPRLHPFSPTPQQHSLNWRFPNRSPMFGFGKNKITESSSKRSFEKCCQHLVKPLQQHAFFQLETCLPRLFPSCDVFCPVTTSFCHRLQEAVLEGVFQCVFKDVSVQRKETGIKQTISLLYFVIETGHKTEIKKKKKEKEEKETKHNHSGDQSEKDQIHLKW